MMNRIMSMIMMVVALLWAVPAMASETTGAVEETGTEAPVEASTGAVEAASTGADEAETGGVEEPAEVDVVEEIKSILTFASDGEWALVVGTAIMLLLALARKFNLLKLLPRNGVPWASVVLGVAAAVADNLLVGGDLSLTRVLQGVLAGLAASGVWSLLGKHLPFLR